MSFDQLSLNPLIQKAIVACGYTEATPIQAKAIPEILAGKDVVACAQTGSGKTAAFVLPALNHLAGLEPIRKPRILILTPTRELASQITTAAVKYGKFLQFNIVSLVGGMSYDPQIRDLKRGADIVVATPGRLIDHMENKRIDLSHIDILILDEADRMLDMGFIEDVDNIARQTPSDRQTLLFSATVDKSIIKIVKTLLTDPVHIDMSKQQISMPKINQLLYKAKNMHHKSRMLKHFLNDENIFKAIIFSATKTNADRLAAELRADGFAAAPLHGDLRQNVRNRTIEALRRGKIQFLVATDVAARGLDINDVSHVINYDLPKNCEDYVHRIGRTGRAGKTGEAISFFTSTDMRNLQSIERYIGKRLTIQSDKFVYAETSTNSRSDADKYSPDAMEQDNHGGGRNRGRQQGAGSRRYNDSGKSFGDRPHKRFDRNESRPERPEGEKRRFDDSASSTDRPRKRFDDKPGSFDKPRKPFNRDEPRSDSSDRPRKPFNRDEPRSAKPFGEKRRFDDRPGSFDKPRKPFNRDEPRSDSSDRPRKPFNRDEPRSAKPFGEKRRFDDRPGSFDKPRKSFNRDEPRSDSSDRPRKRFDRDEPRSAKPFGEKRRFDDKSGSFDRPRKPFNRDEPRSDSSDRPRKPFNRDEPRSAKPFGEKRRFDDKPGSFDKSRKRFDRDDARTSSFDKPRTRSNRDDSRSDKPAGEQRRASVFERPVYEFEQRDDNPRVLYKKRVATTDTRRSESPARSKFAGKSSKFKKDFRNDGTASADKPARSKFARDDAGRTPRAAVKKAGARSAAGSKHTKKPYRDAK